MEKKKAMSLMYEVKNRLRIVILISRFPRYYFKKLPKERTYHPLFKINFNPHKEIWIKYDSQEQRNPQQLTEKDVLILLKEFNSRSFYRIELLEIRDNQEE